MTRYDVYWCEPTRSYSAKSKSKVIEDRMTGWKYLQSYRTIVCAIDPNGGFHRYWDDYSATTMGHINSFLRIFNPERSRYTFTGKKWWCNLEYEPTILPSEIRSFRDLTPRQAEKMNSDMFLSMIPESAVVI